MKLRHAAPALAIALLFPVGAVAQQLSTNEGAAVDPRPDQVLVEVEDSETLLDVFNITVDELKGMTIYGEEGKQVGHIDAILATPDGKVAAVTADVGGFLGIGEREVVIPASKIRFEGLRMSLPMTKEEVEALPKWQG